MPYKNKYFIANWKMFGDFNSLKIINAVNNYITKSKFKKNKVIFCVPNTLIKYFSIKLNKINISLGAQNCHYANTYGPHTGSVNSKMIKQAGAKYVIIGHSENRSEGDTDKMINAKIKSAIKNGLSVIFCIGENKNQKNKNLTNKILSLQINKGLKLIKNLKKIIIAYEPIWSIGTGKISTYYELTNSVNFIRNILNRKFKNARSVKIIYGGSVNKKNIKELGFVKNINGFLIGGASQSAKKFIDILKNYYM